jgi:lysophospholipase L1-like esterase
MKKKILVSVLVLISSYAGGAPSAGASEVPQTMVAIGDSLSTGMLSAHSRRGIWFPLRHFTVMRDSLQMLFTFNKEAFEKRSLSWSTGTQINSHYRHLKSLNPQFEAANLAISSSRILDVWEQQIPSLKEWARRNARADAPDYITLFVGANDLCGDTYAETTTAWEFERYLGLILNEVLEGSRRSKILLLPIPRLDLLVTNAKDAFVLPAPKMTRCQDMWNMIPLCKTVTDATTPAKQRELFDKIQSYNVAMKRQAEALRGKFGDRVRVAWGEAHRLPHPDHLAVDCFHPNKKAQASIAETSWKTTWWYQEDKGR